MKQEEKGNYYLSGVIGSIFISLERKVLKVAEIGGQQGLTILWDTIE